MTTPARALAAAATIVLVVGLAGCGDGDDDTEASGSAAGDPADGGGDETTTTAPPTPEELAVAAYQHSWDVKFQATNPPEQLPEIAETHTGEALSEAVNFVAEIERLGHRVEGSMQTHPVVVSATSTDVVLDDCAVENSVEYDAAGEVVDTADDAAWNYRVTVVNEGGTWKVADFERRDEPCEPA